MHAFKDNTDREWQVEINIRAVKDLRDVLGIDLLDVGGDALTAMIDDPVTLCDVLYVLCRKQADENGVSDEDFGRAMRGDTLDAASTAFLEELTDFFPSRRRRIMSAAMTKLRELEAKATEKGMMVLESDQLDRMLEKTLDKTVRETLGQGSGFGEESIDSPASSESSPDL